MDSEKEASVKTLKCLDGLNKFIEFQKQRDKKRKASSILRDGPDEQTQLAKPGEFLVVSKVRQMRGLSRSTTQRTFRAKSNLAIKSLYTVEDQKLSVAESNQPDPLITQRSKFSINRESTKSLLEFGKSPITIPRLPIDRIDDGAESQRLISSRSNYTRSIKTIMQRQDTDMLIQASRLVHSGVKINITNKTSQAFYKNEDTDSFQPKQSKKFIDRIRQQATQIDPSQMQSIEDFGNVPLHLQTSRHSYKVKSKNAFVKKDGGLAQHAKIPKIPEIVKKQQEMLTQRDRKSPFMVETERIIEPRRRVPVQHTASTDKYLSLELFDPITEDPKTLLEKMRSESDGKVYALANWHGFSNQIQNEMKRCIVESYDHQYDMYIIRWLHNNQTKRFSRFNIEFNLENKDLLKQRIKEAKMIKQRCQKYIQYHYLIDKIDGSNASKIQDDTKAKISYRIQSFYPRLGQKFEMKEDVLQSIHSDLMKKNLNFKSLGQLFQELEVDYQRCAKISKFEQMLPFEPENIKTLKGIISEVKFYPVNERLEQFPPKKLGVIQIDKRAHNFKNIKNLMNKKLHQAEPLKLSMLMKTQMDIFYLSQENLLDIQCKKPKNLDDFMKYIEARRSQVIGRVRNCINDTSYKLDAVIARESSRIREINEQRRFALTHPSEKYVEETVQPEFYDQIREFSVVLNIMYETGLRECFIRSTESLQDNLNQALAYLSQSLNKNIVDDSIRITQEDILTMTNDAALRNRVLRDTFQIKLNLSFSKTHQQLRMQPSYEQIVQEFTSQLQGIADKLDDMPCLQTLETGFSRNIESVLGKAIVFPYCMKNLVPETIQTIQFQLLNILKVPKALEAILEQHHTIMTKDLKKYSQWLKSENLEHKDFFDEFMKYKKAQEHIEQVLFQDYIELGPIQVNCTVLKQQLLQRIDEARQKVADRVKKRSVKTARQIEIEVQEILNILNKENVRDIEELTEIKQFIKDLPEKRARIRQIIKDVNQLMALLDMFWCQQNEEETFKIWEIISEQTKIEEARVDCVLRGEELEKDFFAKLRIMNDDLLKDIEECKLDFEILQGYEQLQEYNIASDRSELLDEKIETCIHIAEISNRREKLFEARITDYSVIFKIKKQFKPFLQLWMLARDYHLKINLWTKGPLNGIDRDQLIKHIQESSVALQKLIRQDFKERRIIAQVAIDLRKLFDDFRPYLPLIFALRSPFLKPRHWQSIIHLREPYLELESDLHQTLEEIIDKGAMLYVEEINEISHYAGREKKLEEQIHKMKDEWKNVRFDLQEFKETYLLHKPEAIWDLLSDQIIKTMAIISSPFVKFLRSEVNYWKQTLVKVQEVLEEWGKVQRGWMYLEPIMTSPDMIAQLPQVSAIFQSIDKTWRSIMQQTQLNPIVIEACFQNRLLEIFVNCNDDLEKIQKSLSDYLGTKRLKFPRFFFLPNDDLLQILSKATEPKQVQPYLNKIFEGIHKLDLEDKKVRGMFSNMQEYIQFSNQVSTMELLEEAEQETVRSVEAWLIDVEDQMRTTLRDQISQARIEQDNIDRKNWLFKWPAQVVLALEQCRWTNSVENLGLNQMKNDSKALSNVFEDEKQRLSQLVELTRSAKDNARDSDTLGALIVLGVHSKDITQELVQQNISNCQEFEWIANFRHYLVMISQAKGQPQLLEIELRMVTAIKLYGFEYLGNQPRLVVTPLTDRCYRTLMVALQLNLGGAPEGPAGTGKTETTKDLSKALAKQCLVFNCSDQLDVETMGQFFRGLACCGAWACFDEFNRIEVEVLSVIASQILQIQTALMRKRPRAPFLFEGEQLMLNPTCAVFITMNPGYAGRSELPDNLKTLFRPVAMMVPNYSMIAEIFLYSFGFQDARELSEKITLSLKLASEQLSTQSHYDYGMRAIKSIISAAGQRKAANPEQKEDYLVYWSILDSSIPKFVDDDVQLFLAILSDLFPTTNKQSPDFSELTLALNEASQERNMEIVEEFTNKAIQLYQTFQVRHGLMLVGAAMSSKTEILKTLAKAQEIMNKEQKTVINQINPKAITIGQLYGDFDPLTHEWSDGILARIVRESALDDSEDRRWILLDGPVDAVWVENLNTVLDDNKKLCLPSGEIIKFTNRMTMVFEVEDLLEASPATVSRCGMVYFTPEQISWNVHLDPWKKFLPEPLTREWRSELLDQLLKIFVEPLLYWFFDPILGPYLSIIQTTTKHSMLRNFLEVLEALLMRGETRSSLAQKEQEEKEKEEARQEALRLGNQQIVSNKLARSTLESLSMKPEINEKKQAQAELISIFLMAAAWGFGAILNDETKKRQLNDLIIEKIMDCDLAVSLRNEDYSIPKQDSNIFDQYYDHTKKKWILWKDALIQDPLPQQNQKVNKDSQQAENSISYINLDEGPQTLIQTEDTLKFTFLISNLTRISKPVLLIGETGTGKSSIFKEFLMAPEMLEKWEPSQYTMSATTKAQTLQAYLESKFEKQRKGVYGPKMQGKRVLIFLDDMGMPAKEKYGAQPPLEFIRFLMSTGTLYDQKDTTLKQVENLVFVAAMGMPEGGRTLPSNRILRQFQIVQLQELSQQTMNQVFSTILSRGFMQHPLECKKLVLEITNLSVELFIKAKEQLLPTPSKSHYQFNVRQVAEMTQGMLLVGAHTIEKSQNKIELLGKLWMNEARRVFSDRLVSHEDLRKVEVILGRLFASSSIFRGEDLLEYTPERVFFCNFFDADANDYSIVADQNSLKIALSSLIERYNQLNSKKPFLDLQLFDYMLGHLSRISRIIKKNKGHGLLVSLGGNGKTTLSKLAIFINDSDQFRTDITGSYGRNEWLDDMKALFKSAGIDNKPLVFTISISEAQNCPGAIEDLSSIANSGEVPNLYGQDDLDEINSEMLRQGPMVGVNVMELFESRCKKNIILLISISPAGDELREHIRLYPALVHCTTIDWFFPWPEQALQAVAVSTLKQDAQIQAILHKLPHEQEDFVDGKTINDMFAPLFVQMYLSVAKAAEKYEEQRGRIVFLTPSRFSEVLKHFTNFLLRKSSNIQEEKQEFQSGIEKLKLANKTIDNLSKQLEELEPQLAQKSKDLEQMVKKLELETKEVEEIQEQMALESLEVQAARDQAQAIKDECEEKLKLALPEFDAALAALKTLKVNDFVTMKSFKQPPPLIKLALEAACIMLGVKPKMVESMENKKRQKVPDYWDQSKKLLSDYKKFLSLLENYEKDEIPQDRRILIDKYLANQDFVPEKIRYASQAAEGICKWVIAVCKYETIAKEIKPRREAYAVACEELAEVEKAFQIKQENLRKIEEKRDKMIKEQQEQISEKHYLVQTRDKSIAKMQRAKQLIDSLGSEQERWLQKCEQLDQFQESIVGDMLLAACSVTYLGPFDGQFRKRIVEQEWKVAIQESSIIQNSEAYTLQQSLATPEKISDWLLNGLPNDSVSIENMIYLEATEQIRWPLIIDPQGQALQFLREYLDHNYVRIRSGTSPQGYYKLLEQSLLQGSSVICENVGDLSNQQALISLLDREIYFIAGTNYIKLGENQVDYHKSFRLFMLTNDQNPLISPKIQQKVQLLNFCVTLEGLQDQLLSIVCKKECQKEEDEKHRLNKQDFQIRKQKTMLQKEILHKLMNSKDDILEDDALLNSLNESKKITADITRKLKSAKHLQDKIENSRKAFKPVAVHGAKLFFVVQSLKELDPMYDFSMKWFRELFQQSLEGDDEDVKEKNRFERSMQLKQKFRDSLLENVSMSLFSHHQLAFAFLLSIKIHEKQMGVFSDNQEAEAFRMKLQMLDQGYSVSGSQTNVLSQISKFKDQSSQRRSSHAPKSIRSGKSGGSSNTNLNDPKVASKLKAQMIAAVQEEETMIVMTDWLNYFLTGLVPVTNFVEQYPLPENCKSFIDAKKWQKVLELTSFECLEGLPEDFEKQPENWKAFMNEILQPGQQSEVKKLLQPFADSELPEFMHILLYQVLKPGEVVDQIKKYVNKALGEDAFNRPPVILKDVYDSKVKASTPILLLLTPGNDPMESISRLGEDKQRIPYHVSLGKGQSEKAKALIADVRQYGGWVVLQNCHLAPSFMKELAQIIETLQPQSQLKFQGQEKDKSLVVHQEFRLWLTSTTTSAIPSSILQTSIKLTSEPPKGIKASLLRSLNQVQNSKQDRELFNSSSKSEIWKPLFFALTVFHAAVRERRKYGPIGWNTHYDFNDSDLLVSMRQLHMMLETFDKVPFKSLKYLTGECNYGGRVTDEQDRRTLKTMLEDFYCQDTVQQSRKGYNFQNDIQSQIKIVNVWDLQQYIDYTKSLTDEDSPFLVGLHSNATINQVNLEAHSIIFSILQTQRQSSDLEKSSSESSGTQQIQIIEQIQVSIRQPFDEITIKNDFPFRYEDSMNVVLVQEVSRYNRLLKVIHTSLKACILVLKGQVITTKETEAILDSIFSNKIPEAWQKRAYPSLKPLKSWIENLSDRLAMLEQWIQKGSLPQNLWISGLFFPQSFLTAAKQDYARKYGYPIDLIEIGAEIADKDSGPSENDKSIWVNGMYLQGACWSTEFQKLIELEPGICEKLLPNSRIILKLIQESCRHANDKKQSSLYQQTQLFQFECPIYRTSERKGTLSTTGHSTNFVMMISVPCEEDPKKWVKRGTAIVLATNE